MEKGWQGAGYHPYNKAEDERRAHFWMFLWVTICIGGGFWLGFVGDAQQMDWAQREAFLRMRECEAKGLPYVDPNFVDPSKIKLPTEEELGDTEVIV